MSIDRIYMSPRLHIGLLHGRFEASMLVFGWRPLHEARSVLVVRGAARLLRRLAAVTGGSGARRRRKQRRADKGRKAALT